MKLFEIVGLKVAAVKGWNPDKSRKRKGFEPQYILFDDGETYIELEEQDYYSFHDCSSLAREITVLQDKKTWRRIMDDDKYYPHADCEI